MRTIPILLAIALAPWAPALEAGEFMINPLRVNLDRTVRASEVVVRNDDREPLRLQVQGMRWSQDAEGKDQYEAAEELIYFPRAMELAPGESRVVRVGVKAAPVTREETYRLFIEELPSPASTSTSQPQGTALRVFLRVGVAVFVAPAQPEPAARITALDLRGGVARWTVENPGNAHFRAERVELRGVGRDGSRVFSQAFPERYFLAGVAKALTLEIDHDTCRRLASLEASVVGDGVDAGRKLDVSPGSCP